MAASRGTYVYCVIAAARRPQVSKKPRGLTRMGPVRLLHAGGDGGRREGRRLPGGTEVESGLYLVVADAPLERYGEESINRGLADLQWVSRAAVAHEAVVESFIGETAVLPMKLFTIFTSDRRALEHIDRQRARIAALIKRVANHQEWGVRLVLERGRAETRRSARGTKAAGPGPSSGAAYLTGKKAQRDATVELASRARETVAGLYDRLEAKSKLARRRPARELPVQGGPLLLDAAFLVPRARAASFQIATAREARTLARQGYGMTVSGPWPPYTFVQE